MDRQHAARDEASSGQQLGGNYQRHVKTKLGRRAKARDGSKGATNQAVVGGGGSGIGERIARAAISDQHIKTGAGSNMHESICNRSQQGRASANERMTE